MAGKFSFRLKAANPRRGFPDKLIVGQHEFESREDVLLKGLAYLLFFRERLQMDIDLHMDSIPYRPDLVQLDYELRPILWVECGDCPLKQLDKLAVKAPEAEIWVVKGSVAAAEELRHLMAKAELRRNRYSIVGLEGTMVEELCGSMRNRNEVFWVKGGFDPPEMQFDFNGLWFEGSFSILPF